MANVLMAARPRQPPNVKRSAQMIWATVKLAVPHTAQEGIPFSRRESEHRALRIFAITNLNQVTGKPGNFYTVSVGETV